MIYNQLQLACMFVSNVKAVLKARNISSTKRNASPPLCSSPPPFLLIRVGDYWRVSTEVGKEGGCLRAEVEKADQLAVPPVNRRVSTKVGVESQGGGGGPAGATGQWVAVLRPQWQLVVFRPNAGVQQGLVRAEQGDRCQVAGRGKEEVASL